MSRVLTNECVSNYALFLLKRFLPFLPLVDLAKSTSLTRRHQGKKFDKVTRIMAKSHTSDVELTLDINRCHHVFSLLTCFVDVACVGITYLLSATFFRCL